MVCTTSERLDAPTIWLTGLSGSGKTTIAHALAARMRLKGWIPLVLDGDEIRKGLCSDLGFSASERTENVRRVAEVAKVLNRNGMVAIVALISPLVSDRAMARAVIGSSDFVEVFVDAQFGVCATRDVKGLYAKALKGDLGLFTGLTAPYEIPLAPDVHLLTAVMDVGECVEVLMAHIRGAASTDSIDAMREPG